MRKFKNVAKGKKIKLDENSNLTYTKKNKTEASCDQESFGIILHPDDKVIQLD